MTRVDVGFVAYNALIVGVGYALLFAFGLARIRRSEWRLLALAYLLGWAFLGSVLTFLLIAGVDPEVVTVVVVAVLTIEVSIFAGRRMRKTEIIAHRGRASPVAFLTATAGAAALAAAAAFALIVGLKGTWPSEWDALWFWVPKAKVIYYFHGLETGIGGWGAQENPEYPPLAAVMAAASSHFTGGFHPSILNVQAVVLGIGFLGSIPALIDRFVPRWLTFPLLALLAVTPGFWWRMQSLLADQTLAYLAATAAVACVIWLREPRGAWLALAVVLLVAMTLTKLEGSSLALLLFAVVAGGAFALRRRAGSSVLLLLLGPAAILPWHLWLRLHHFRTSATDYRASDLLRPTFLVDHWSHFTYASHHILHSLFRPGVWLIVMPLAILGVALAARRVPVLSAVMALWIVGAVLGLGVLYWVSTHQGDFALYMLGNVDRVASTIVIVAGTLCPLLLGLALGEDEVAETVDEAVPGR